MQLTALKQNVLCLLIYHFSGFEETPGLCYFCTKVHRYRDNLYMELPPHPTHTHTQYVCRSTQICASLTMNYLIAKII